MEAVIELDKKDVEALAQSRFTRQYWKRLIAWAIVIVVVVIISMRLLPDEPLIWQTVVSMIPMIAVYIWGAIWWVKASGKATKELIEQWQKDTGQ